MKKRLKNNLLFSLVLIFLTILLLALVIAVSSFNSPSSCSGQWTSCSNAFADNANRATASINKAGIWKNYGFNISDSSLINSVKIRADFFASKTNGYINVKVSGNNGNSYGAIHQVGGNTAEQTFWIDVTNDINWTGTKLNNANFLVNVTCVKVGSGGNPTCNLDWIPVEVNYTLIDQCTRGNPSVLIKPDTQNGTAGQTLIYNTNVTNTDSSACNSSDFNMGKIIPSAWTGSFADNVLSIAPGATGTTTFSLTSNINASLGNYNFVNNATRIGLPGGSDIAIYQVI